MNGSTDVALQSNGKQSSITSQNGKTSGSEEGEETTHINNVQKKKKKKNNQKEKQLLKKEARELRARTMSTDIELFKFSNVTLPENDINDMEVFQNGHSHKSMNSKSLNKRDHDKTVEENREPKKRRKSINSV